MTVRTLALAIFAMLASPLLLQSAPAAGDANPATGNAAQAPNDAAKPPRPNIIFIITDDQRWDSMGCAGHPFLKTPGMDRIAREGAYFENAFVTTPLCSPARGSFLTGKYVHSHGIDGNSADYNAPSHRLVTFPRLLHDAGYETAFVGKWHMGNDDTPRPGFDHWAAFKGQGRYIDCPINVDGEVVKEKGYITDVLTEHALKFINAEHEKPFALYLGHKAVHGPFRPADRHRDLYKDDPIPWRPNVKDDLSGKPVLRRNSGPEPEGHPAFGVTEQLVRDQLRCLVSVDESVQKILDALDAKKLADDTLIIFTSDNGYFWNEHNLGDKRAAYEEGIRVPMVMRYPRLIKAGTRVSGVALNIDILPTLLDLAGAEVPGDVQGQSLVPLLKGQAPADWRPSALFEYFHEQHYPRIPTWHAVRTSQFKYIHYDDPQYSEMDELYDLQADPYEMTNLATRPESAETLKQMKAELEKLLDATK